MLIDTHCHLTSPGLVEQVDVVLARAAEAGVKRLILVGVNVADAQAAAVLLANRPALYLVAGIHPHEAGRCDADSWTALTNLLRGARLPADVCARIVGVGETGLDWHYDFAPRARQEEVFEAHLALAVALQLPIVIHARESEARVCEILAGHPQLADRVVWHCFSAGTDIARRALDLGGHFSFTGVVTFKNANTIREAASYVPLERLMLETDAPYLSPEPLRKVRPNEPALLVHTARRLAELRGVDFETLAAATTATAVRFFRLPEVRP
ncbi:MAG: TatD family hydrolase [Phycisphaerae bacterium]|nr:TatD family hydrolase [Phycisphaerae bacterium]